MECSDHYIIFSGVFNWPGIETLSRHTGLLEKYYSPWWTRKERSAAEGLLNFASEYYYATFLDAHFPEARYLRGRGGGLPSTEEYLSFCGKSKSLCRLTLKDPGGLEGFSFSRERESGGYTLPLSMPYAELYLFPEGSGLFSLKVKAGDGGVPFGVLSDLIFAFREKSIPAFSKGGKPYTASAILEEFLFKEEDFDFFKGSISENTFNNKYKSYLIAESDIPVATETEKQSHHNLLYELGTVSPVGTLTDGGDFAPSETYRQELLSQNALSVFNNWTALSLFDTFTVLFNKKMERKRGCAFYNFEDLYFPIYIQNLHLKYFCFHTNETLSLQGLHSRNNRKLRDRFIRTTNRYVFSHISYNFLPNLLHTHIRDALDLPEEITQMEEKIDRINTYVNEKADSRTNVILAFLSLVALGSTFWDMSEWFQKLFGIEGSSYNSMSFSLVIITGILCLWLFVFMNRRH